LSMAAKHRSITLVFGLVLIILGAALIVVPAGAWKVWTGTKLASIGTDQYGVTLTMDLYLQDGTKLTGPLICGSTTNLANPSPDCYNHNPRLVGSASDPWAIYDLTSTNYPASTTLLKAHGTLTYNGAGSWGAAGSAVKGVAVDISWYFVGTQPSGSFQVFPMTETSTNSQGVYDSQYFQVPSQANNMKIVWFAEVYKGPYSSPEGCAQFSTSSAYCFAQSPHYLMSVGPLVNQTGLSIWVGQGCAQTNYPTASSTCFKVWEDGADKYGAQEVSVTLPFTIIAVATVGPDIGTDSSGKPLIYVHAKNLAYGSPIEQNCFPAQMRKLSSSYGYQGGTKGVYVLVIGSLTSSTDCLTRSAGSDTGIPIGRFDMEFTTSTTPPWVQSSVVLAIIHIGSTGGVIDTSTWTWPSITLTQWVGGIFALFGVGMVGVAIVPRKRP
jgi:hypothetical protein